MDADLYVTSTYDFLRTPAELVQAQLAKIGIRTKIVAADWSVYLPTVFQKHYTLTILGNSGQADPDDFLYNPFHTGVASNYLNYSDAQFDKLVEQGRAVSGEAQRRAIYQQAQQRLQDTVPMVFLFYSTQYEALRNNVHGYQHWLTTSYLGLRTTWIDPLGGRAGARRGFGKTISGGRDDADACGGSGSWALVLLLVVPTALAQAPGPRYGGTLRAGMQTDPVGLDPHLTTATATRNMMENVFDTLVQVDPNLRIIPGLATSWTTSPDGLVWTFTLRGNVKFHNGRAMTADDVVYSLNRIRDPKTKSPRASDFAIVDSVTATGPLTVAIRLKQPFSPLLAKLALSTNVIVPHEVVEKDGDLNTEPVGTGPYRFVEYTPQQRLVLVRSGDFWGFDATGRRLPYIDRIEFDFYPDAVARATALQDGERRLDRVRAVVGGAESARGSERPGGRGPVGQLPRTLH